MSTTIHLLQGLLARGWTQSDITRRTGIPQPRLSKWARGKAPSGAEDALKLKALADAGELPAKPAAVPELQNVGRGAAAHGRNVAPAVAGCASNLTVGEKV